MSRLLARASLGFLHQHPWQLLLAVIGVALGVAVVVSIDLASTSAAAFTYSTEAVVGKATHRVVGGAQRLDEKLFTRLRLQQGFKGLRGLSDCGHPRWTPFAPARDRSPGRAELEQRSIGLDQIIRSRARNISRR